MVSPDDFSDSDERDDSDQIFEDDPNAPKEEILFDAKGGMHRIISTTDASDPEKVRMEFHLSPEALRAIRRLQELCGHETPQETFQKLIALYMREKKESSNEKKADNDNVSDEEWTALMETIMADPKVRKTHLSVTVSKEDDEVLFNFMKELARHHQLSRKAEEAIALMRQVVDAQMKGSQLCMTDPVTNETKVIEF